MKAALGKYRCLHRTPIEAYPALSDGGHRRDDHPGNDCVPSSVPSHDRQGLEVPVGTLTANDLGNRIIKVDHAGEHGAVSIYTGQMLMARFTAPSLVSELSEFKSHEMRHRETFRLELERRGQPRCRSYWLCGFGGLVLGVLTGIFGSNAIAATTVAVERVVLRHLEQQMAVLASRDPSAVAAIAAIVADEREHYGRSAAQARSGKLWSKVLTPVVSASTETVIWLGMHL